MSTEVQERPAEEFINEVKTLDRLEREEVAIDWITNGNVPTHMKQYVEISYNVRCNDGITRNVKISVLPDYLSVGNDHDFIRIPLTPLSAQKIADAFDCSLPTAKIVDVIWNNCVNRYEPEPWGPPYDASMMSLERLVAHDAKIHVQATKKKFVQSNLSAGHKKDVILTKKLLEKPTQVAIYGWHKRDGVPIQGVYLGHENTYADYSHGIRLVSNNVVINGEVKRFSDIISDQMLSSILTNEGANSVSRQPEILKNSLCTFLCTVASTDIYYLYMVLASLSRQEQPNWTLGTFCYVTNLNTKPRS